MVELNEELLKQATASYIITKYYHWLICVMYCNSCVPSGEHLLSLFLCHVSCVRLSEPLAGTLFLYFYPSRNVFIHRILIFCQAIVKIVPSDVFIFEAEDWKTKQSFLFFFLPLPLTSHSLSLCMFPPSLHLASSHVTFPSSSPSLPSLSLSLLVHRCCRCLTD